MLSIMTTIKSYRELVRLETFEDRLKYLMLHGRVGATTFGFDRHINQAFYTSYEWKRARDHVISRDNGCDLGVPGYEIYGSLLIHHINPMVADDIVHGEESIFDPNNLITTTNKTHNAIHFSDMSLINKPFVERKPGDTRLW
jgi:hypothetical protein